MPLVRHLLGRCFRFPRRFALLAGFAVAGLPVGLFIPSQQAQAQCRPSKGSNEARLLAFYSAPITFAADFGAPTLPLGGLRVSAEVVPVPSPNAGLQQTGACFLSKSENTHLSPVFGRPRVALGIGGGFVLDASYLPPVTIADATPHLGGIGLSRFMPLGRVALLVRAHATMGSVRGPITCPKSALQTSDPSAPCYGSAESRDTFHPTMQGAEVLVGSRNATQRMTFFVGAGVSALRPRFRVGFTDLSGNVDNTRIEVNLTRVALLGGVTFRPLARCDIGGQLYSVPSDVTTLRIVAGCRVR